MWRHDREAVADGVLDPPESVVTAANLAWILAVGFIAVGAVGRVLVLGFGLAVPASGLVYGALGFLV